MAKQSNTGKASGFGELLENIKTGRFSSYYLLMGEEPWYTDILLQELNARVLTEDEKGFNYHLFYGGECNDVTVVETARRYPMMAEKQMVVLREAQLMRQMDAFSSYFSNPMSSTVLVVCLTNKSLDKRGSVYKTALSGGGAVFESQLMKEYQVAGWIENFVNTGGYSIEPSAGALMAEFCGTDLRKLSSECKKLFAFKESGDNLITAADVELNTGISREYNAFELGKALTSKNRIQAFKIVVHFGTNPKQYPLVLTLGSLFFHFSKLLRYHSMDQKTRSNPGAVASALGINPYFVKDYETAASNYTLRKTMEAIAIIRKFDSMSKSNERGEASDSDLLRELITRIIY
jgi:DNA polymerase-3 subunit delta